MSAGCSPGTASDRWRGSDRWDPVTKSSSSCTGQQRTSRTSQSARRAPRSGSDSGRSPPRTKQTHSRPKPQSQWLSDETRHRDLRRAPHRPGSRRPTRRRRGAFSASGCGALTTVGTAPRIGDPPVRCAARSSRCSGMPECPFDGFATCRDGRVSAQAEPARSERVCPCPTRPSPYPVEPLCR